MEGLSRALQDVHHLPPLKCPLEWEDKRAFSEGLWKIPVTFQASWVSVASWDSLLLLVAHQRALGPQEVTGKPSPPNVLVAGIGHQSSKGLNYREHIPSFPRSFKGSPRRLRGV